MAAFGCIDATGADAALEIPFATQFATNVRGGVAVAANTLMTCPDLGGTEAKCLESRAGTATGAALNNNAYAMERVDVDADLLTFDSSSATLSLPTGATVEFAGLYYGARTSSGKGGVAAPEAAARGSVLLRSPGDPGYEALSATVGDSAAVAGGYTGFVDVTAQVAAAGEGEYWVADVQAGTGEDRYAGWSLIVVYGDPASPPRSIRVFDGLASIVANEAPLEIGIAGLDTPPSGSVAAQAGVVAYEGDRGAAGDQLSLAGRPLSDSANPLNNTFNSSIAVDGVDATAKNPDYVNQLGFDSDLIEGNGILANGATEATLAESTRLEQYLTQAIVVAIELDPTALEPAVVSPPPQPPPSPQPAPPSEPTPRPGADHHHRGGGNHPGGGKGHPSTNPAPVSVEVSAPQGVVRPTEVVPVRITVEAQGGVAKDIRVCNTDSPGLTLLRAPSAKRHGASACWHLAKLPRGERRTFLTTSRVEATTAQTALSRTVVRARGSRTVRRVTRIHVAPLRATACGSGLSGTDTGTIALRC